jgi:hypothetical protein
MNNFPITVSCRVIGLLMTSCTTHAANIYYNASGYEGRADNPFLANVAGGLIYVEDFENQGSLRPQYLLTTPNATGWNGSSIGSPSAGVREDYSIDEPENLLGYRWSNSSRPDESSKLPTGIHFDFSPDSQGRLPEYAGAALRGSSVLGDDPDFNIILVYDRNGMEVTNGEWRIPKPIPDPNQPIEDLFLNFEGIYVPGGISRIHFRDFREVDHLTYGYAIPEPSAAGLALGSVFWLMRRQRTRGLSL